MTTPHKPFFLKPKKNPNQIFVDIAAMLISNQFGANVVPQEVFEQNNHEKEEALRKVKDIEQLRSKIRSLENKCQELEIYQNRWYQITNNFEKRSKKLKDENVYVDLSDFPKEIADNFSEAYNCYINGLLVSSYIMILRTIEITVSLIYLQFNEKITDNKGRTKIIPAIQQLNWVKNKKLVGGAHYILAKSFIEARNEAVHEWFEPTEKLIISTFETVINLVNILKSNIK